MCSFRVTDFFTNVLFTTQIIFYVQKLIQDWDLAYPLGDPNIILDFPLL